MFVYLGVQSGFDGFLTEIGMTDERLAEIRNDLHYWLIVGDADEDVLAIPDALLDEVKRLRAEVALLEGEVSELKIECSNLEEALWDTRS